MFEKIVDTVANNKNACMYSLLGASLLAGYFCLGRDMLSKHYGVQLRRKKNLLDTSFQELCKANKQPNIMKIVFTEADKSSGNYRKMVIEKIKDTFPNMGFGVLINCSPKKLYDAGCEAFIATFQHDDEEYVDYIINFLKTELLIEDTIQKIQNVSQMQKANPRFSIMICDNSCMDMKNIVTFKGTSVGQRIQQMALERLNIKQYQLYDIYSCVINLQEDPSIETQLQIAENKKIEQLWGNQNYRGFYQKFKYNKQKTKQDNVNVVIKFIVQRISAYKKQQQQIQQGRK